MGSEKVSFTNANGDHLSARLELPVNQHPHTYALFAHGFTFNKNLTAVRNISRAMSINGIGVLRFDYTGLGESEGDVAGTNFSSSIDDLLEAARFLEAEYEAPAILVGHSLGGAAVIAAAAQLDSVRAVATIGTPFDPDHVIRHLDERIDEIKEKGRAEVRIDGRSSTVRKQFLEDIRQKKIEEHLSGFGKAILIMHSPQDKIVKVEDAAKLYHAARHPKSFVTLDGADHLLSDKRDSRYVGDLIACWAQRYINISQKEALQTEKEVTVRLGNEGFTTDIMVRQHSLTADEPENVGGNDFGPSPYELVSAGLGACTAMTLQMYARRKKWDLQEVVVNLEHYKDYAEDMKQCEEEKSKIDHFDRIIEVKGNLEKDQRERLLEIANKCPVHRTLLGDIKVNSKLKD
jgi:uncharacterized OsmC-like protein/alpha-beta hydrolase superfamily lysophospholipase